MAGEGAPTWEEVARSHGRFLYTVAYRLTGNREDAQDLVQEVLIRVRRGLATYQPGSMEGWLSRIATNVFLDDVRRSKRRPVEALPERPDRVLPPAPAPEDALAAAVLPDDVQAAILRLPQLDLPTLVVERARFATRRPPRLAAAAAALVAAAAAVVFAVAPLQDHTVTPRVGQLVQTHATSPSNQDPLTQLTPAA